MTTAQREKIGRMPCEGQRCRSHDEGRLVTVYRSTKTGTLGYRCEVCDRAPYAKNGTDQFNDWMMDLQPLGGSAEVQEMPPPAAKPAAETRKSFSMEGL